MKTKIEEAKDLKWQYESNKKEVQECLGNQELNGFYVDNPNNDKHNFKFSTNKHHSSKPIFLDAYYGYYGDSHVHMFNNDFYIECMTEAINKNMALIREETEKIMEQKCNNALLEAKSEAEEILKTIRDLGLD